MTDDGTTEALLYTELPEDHVVCQICHSYTGTPSQLRGHHMKCKERQNQPLKMKTPEELQAEIDEAKAQLSTTQETLAAVEPEPRKREQPDRKERIPIGVRRKRLTAPGDKGFHEHIFNDNWRKYPNRIHEALRGGYEPIPDCKSNPVGSNDDGSAIMGVAMRLPIELYEQDQALKQRVIDRTEATIQAGTYEVNPQDRRYITSKARIGTTLGKPFTNEEIETNG